MYGAKIANMVKYTGKTIIIKFFGKHDFGYKFVDDFLLYYFYDEKDITNTVIERLEAIKSQKELLTEQKQLSYNIISSWWECEDNEIEQALNKLPSEILEEKYDIRKLSKYNYEFITNKKIMILVCLLIILKI